MTVSMKSRRRTRSRPPLASRRVGYAVAIAVNVVMLVIAVNLLDWGWFPWLTSAFDDVVPLIVFSLAVSIVLNAAWLFFDPPRFRSVGQIITNVVSVIVTVRLYQVFPFDFSPYDFNWGAVARIVMIVAAVGAAVGALADVAKLARETNSSQPGPV